MAGIVLAGVLSLGAYFFNKSNTEYRDTITEEDIQTILKTSKEHPITFKGQNFKTILADKSKVLVDPNREYKDLCTQCVVQEFFASKESLYEFLYFVYSTFDAAIAMYSIENDLDPNDIVFLFKGGNIMRIISNEFLLELPAYASKKIHAYYDPFFKRSDADFGIYIRPDLPEFERYFDELTTLSYYLQIAVRSVFMNKLTRFFDYFKYNTEYQHEIMEKWLIQFQDSASIKNPDNKLYNGSKMIDFGLLDVFASGSSIPYKYVEDIAEDFASKKHDRIVSYDLSENNGQFMYISLNRALEFLFGGERNVKFNLVRTKVNFNMIYQTPDGMEKHKSIGGELIDVSIGHIESTNALGPFFDDLEAHVSTYKLQLQGDKTVEFRSFSLQYLIHDLEFVLFLEEDSPKGSKPWDDSKYAKRINRLIYLYFIDLFIKTKSNQYRRKYLHRMSKYIIKPLIDGEPANLEKFKDMYGNKAYQFNHILYQIPELLAKTDDHEKLAEYLQLWQTNLDVLVSTFADIKEYCNTAGQFPEEELYSGNMGSVI